MEDPKGDRWFRAQGPAFAVALLVSIVIAGTLGFHRTEGWGLWRSFYVSFLAITTVDIPPLSFPGFRPVVRKRTASYQLDRFFSPTPLPVQPQALRQIALTWAAYLQGCRRVETCMAYRADNRPSVAVGGSPIRGESELGRR